MPPEPLPWDRKDFFKERKHERSESLGSVARWRDSSHHGSREFSRWGSADFRRPPGHGKQGGWHLFSEDSGHGYALSRSSDKMLEEENCRPSVSRGDGKYGRNSRENRGSFSQRDWRGHSWEATNGSLNLSRRPLDVTLDQRSADDMLTYPSHPHSDFVNTWDQHHMKDQHDKAGGVDGLGTAQRLDREHSLGSIDWKPLKWTRSGSLSSRGSGFSHTSSSRSMGGADSNEAKSELHPKNATPIESHSGDGAACATSSAPCDDTISRKKPRLNWGEGLAKYEKKKTEEPDVSASKDGPVLSTSNMEPSNFLGSNLLDKSPKVTGFPDCPSPATPSSVACSSSPGVEDKLYGKAVNSDTDVSNLNGSPDPGPQNHLQTFSFNLEKLDIDSLSSLGSSLMALLQSDDLSFVDPGIASSAAMNKLLIWKADLSKVLEVTEAEIDLLESELKLLKSESGNNCPCPAALASSPVRNNAKSCEEHVGGYEKVSRPEPLQICSSADPDVEKMSPSTKVHNMHENGKEEDIDSPGTATSKFVEPQPLIKAVSLCDIRRNDNCSGDFDAIQSASSRCLVPCCTSNQVSVSACGGVSTAAEVKDGTGAIHGASVCSSSEHILYNAIISSNKEYANSVCEEFVQLLPKDCCKVGNVGAISGSCSSTGVVIQEKFAERKRLARIRERVITLKFKALHHKWKEDMRLLSVRKCRPKSHKKLEVGIRMTNSGSQKNRSSIRSRISYPGNNLNLVPTSQINNFATKLLSDPQVKVYRGTLKMPALILDDKEKMISRFPCSNGLVEDPLAYEKERAMINPWISEEKNIFMEKFAAFGKDFRKIASFLDHKTTADCVEFYYKNHKSECFEKIKQDVRKLGKSYLTNGDLVAKKWNREINADSLEILSAASLMAGHADRMNGNKKMHSGSSLLGGYGNMKRSKGEDNLLETSNSFDALRDEREAVAADVLAGICGSLSSEAMSSCITSSVDPVDGNRDRKCLKVNTGRKQLLTPDVTQSVDDDTCSDESCEEMDPTDWTDEERSAFLQAVSSFGKDFAKISRCVGSRSQDQCKVFFSKARKCLGLDLMRPKSVIAGYPVNDANGGGSDTDDACVVETGSAIGADRSGTRTDDDQPLSVMNTYSNEFNSVDPRVLSTNLNKSNNNIGTEVDQDAEDVDDMVSDEDKPKPGYGDGGDGLYGSDKSGPASVQTAINMLGSIEMGEDDANKLAGAVTQPEPCPYNSVAEAKQVSEVSSGGLGNELSGPKQSLVPCLDDRDNKHEVVADDVVELKSSVQDSSAVVNASLLSAANSCTSLNLGVENQQQASLGEPCISALTLESSQPNAKLLLQDPISMKCEKTVLQDQLPSACNFQGRDIHCHNSASQDGQHVHIPSHLLDHVETTSILQGFSLPVKKEVKGAMSCSSSASELPLMSQKIEQAGDRYKTELRHSVDSELTSRNGDVKLFGKILTNPSAAQKSNLNSKGHEDTGTRHPKLSSKSTNTTLKFNCHGHQNADGNSTILKFDRGDYNIGLENVPMRSYGYWDGNKIQTGIPSLPDSAILLAKYPAAFSNYPTSSAKLEQQPLHVFSKSNEQHLNGSAFTTREMNSSNGVIDYQMFRREVPKVQQPFMVEMKNRQDVFSEVQRRNGFEAIANLQQQGRGMVGLNGVGRPGIRVGGSHSGVSDFVAAIKMLHHSNSDQYVGHNGSIMREDESWGGKKGDLSR